MAALTAVGNIELNAGAIITDEKTGKRYCGYNVKRTRTNWIMTAAKICKIIGV